MEKEDIEPKKIYVSNIPYDTEEPALRTLFSEYGRVLSVVIVKDKETQKSRGFAFVEFETEEEANEAREVLDESMFEGRALRVSHAKKRSNRNRKDERK